MFMNLSDYDQTNLDRDVRNMAVKNVFVLIALVIGCQAIPAPDTSDVSMFFDNADTAQERIVGGTEAPVGSAPHMVALTSGVLIRSFSCGASLISSRTVLTAAHCIDAQVSFGSLSSSLRGTLGTNTWNLGGASYAFNRFVNHPDWTSSTIKNDIGLLFTSVEVFLSETIAIVPLSFDYVPGGLQVRVTGWGRIRAGGSLSNTLLELYKHTISGEQCVADRAQAVIELGVNAPPVDPAVELCTFHSAGHGMCNGDSGSALVAVASGQQVGIVSWGFPCARGAPDMFVRVSNYRNWLIANAV